MKDPILPVGNCPVVEMVPRELYEESKKQTADAMVLVSDLKQNLTEAVEHSYYLNDVVDDMAVELKSRSERLVDSKVETQNAKALVNQLKVAVAVLAIIIAVMIVT